LVELRLRRCGIDARAIDFERQAMQQVVIAPTIDRSVLGIMVDFARTVPYHLEPGRWDDSTLASVEALLAETPCHAMRSFEHVIFPDKRAPELLRAKWLEF
jgi:hypothetical protein